MKTFRLAPSLLSMIVAISATTGFGQGPEPPRGKASGPKEPVTLKEKPRVEKIGDSRFRLGDLEFDAKTKEIFIPAVVNMREGGPIEYFLVQENGKVHESILATAVSPLSLQIVLKLLKYKTGHGDIFNVMLPAGDIESKGGKAEDRGAAVRMTAQWEVDGEKKNASVDEWIIDGQAAQPLGDAGWVCTGSEVRNGSYMAEVEGGIVSVYLDPYAVFSMTAKGSDIDERWGANSDAIPKIGQKITLVISPEDS